MGFKIRILSIIELTAYFAQEVHSYTNFLVNKRRQVLLKRIANLNGRRRHRRSITVS